MPSRLTRPLHPTLFVLAGLLTSASMRAELPEEAEAMFQMGRACYKGEGTARDFAKAAWYFRRAAEAGHAKAQTTLGTMLVEGRGIDKDLAEAMRLFQTASASGDAPAKLNLGWMALDGIGRDRDTLAGLEYYREAAEAGLAEAQLRLGDLYYRGRTGIEANRTEAAKWLAKAASQGTLSAQNTLGVMLETGDGVPKDLEKAFGLFRDAAEAGDPRAQMNLGRLFADGAGVAEDLSAACYWFAVSANGGEVSGEKRMADLVFRGRVTMKHVAEAQILAASFVPKSHTPKP